jgi:hypothetical protein
MIKTTRVFNFAAGRHFMPVPVLEEARDLVSARRRHVGDGDQPQVKNI